VLNCWTVPPETAPQRLDALLRTMAAPGGTRLSRRQARDLCAVGAVAVDSVVAGPNARVSPGQQVALDPDLAPLALRLGLPVVFADDAVVVLHKPPGLAVHGGPLVDASVADALARELPGAGLAQRLDREASGLLLVGRTGAVLAALGAAMERGDVERDYLAIVAGEVGFDRRTIDLPLRATDEPRGDQPKVVVDPAGQRAVSHVTVLERTGGRSLVRVQLETGRTHQIRAHLAAIGHPLLGDPRYGDAAANAAARATFGVRRTLLHGARLCFPHPATGAPVVAEAMQETDFVRLFPALRRRR